DISLVRPDGTQVGDTFLTCDPNAQPNGYSSYCSSAPNERLSVVNPAAGTWTVNVHPGLVAAPDAVRGLWSVTYPPTTALPNRASAAIALSASQPASVTGQPVDLTATVTNAAGLPMPDQTVAWSSTGVGALGHLTTVTDSFGRVHAQALSGAPGPETVTVTTTGRSASTALTWLGISPPDLSCVIGCLALTDTAGKVSGGGSWSSPGGKRSLSVTAQHSPLSTSTSGQLGFDNRSSGQVAGGVQHLSIDRNGVATITGTASLNGLSGYGFTLTVTDRSTGDLVHLVVTTATGAAALDETGVLSKGDVVLARS
ncbi:MAG: hypothetical protein JWM22_2583, partial [Frankiales bacterium]|nr:hypothetical protein [Frankiales bacterium]